MNLEVLKLGSCTDLLELPKSIRSLHKLCILDISDCLSIRHLPKDIGELCNLKELHMKGCMSLRKGCHHQLQNLSNWSLWYVIKRGPSGWKRYQLDLVSQTMISENCLFLENFVGSVNLLSLSSTLCFFFLTFRPNWAHEKICISRKYDCFKS